MLVDIEYWEIGGGRERERETDGGKREETDTTMGNI